MSVQPGPQGPETICAFNPPVAQAVPHIELDDQGNPKHVRLIARFAVFPVVNEKMFCSRWNRKLELADGTVVDLVEAQRNRD